MAVAHALVVATMISAGHISGGHLNPAVTLGLLVGGHITLFRSILYWIDQLLASAAACYLLYFLSGGLVIITNSLICSQIFLNTLFFLIIYSHWKERSDTSIVLFVFPYSDWKVNSIVQTTPVHTLASGVGYAQGVIWEIILTFSLLFSVYATMVDPKKGAIGGLGPTLVGFVVGANILAGGAFSAASMNPARSFGPALVSGNWTDHSVYWVGPLIGGALAGFIYETFFINRSHVPVPRDEENY